MEQRIGFLYLKTGGGHISGANALVARLQEKYPDNAEYIPQNGFKNTNRISRIFFEKGYLATSNYFELGYVAFYQLTKPKRSPNWFACTKYLFRLHGLQSTV